VKKNKQPGENISLKTKKKEDPLVMQWINSQSNLMDSIRYLIECEIMQHGVRNLQAFIPMERKIMMDLSKDEPTPVTEGNRTMKSSVETIRSGINETSKEPVEQVQEEQVADDEIDADDIDAWI